MGREEGGGRERNEDAIEKEKKEKEEGKCGRRRMREEGYWKSREERGRRRNEGCMMKNDVDIHTLSSYIQTV